MRYIHKKKKSRITNKKGKGLFFKTNKKLKDSVISATNFCDRTIYTTKNNERFYITIDTNLSENIFIELINNVEKYNNSSQQNRRLSGPFNFVGIAKIFKEQSNSVFYWYYYFVETGETYKFNIIDLIDWLKTNVDKVKKVRQIKYIPNKNYKTMGIVLPKSILKPLNLYDQK